MNSIRNQGTTAEPAADQAKVWLVTGASRGLGRQIVEAALRRGDRVAATARDPRAVTDTLGERDDLLALPLDVTDEEAAAHAVAATVERFGRLDVVVNNAGFGLFGAVEETSAAAAQRVFATNVAGVLAVTRAALPRLRAQRSGHVINISSLGGFQASAGWGVYGASKAAVEGISEALAAELGPLGVRVTVVEPGFFRTDFLGDASLHQVDRRIADYDASIRRDAAHRTHGRQPGDPARAADAICTVAHADTPPLRLALGDDALARIRGKLAGVATELNTWEALSRSTALPQRPGPDDAPTTRLLALAAPAGRAAAQPKEDVR